MKLPRSLPRRYAATGLAKLRPNTPTDVTKLWSIVALAILLVSFPANAQNSAPNSKRPKSPAATLATDDWLQFSGPNGTGVADAPGSPGNERPNEECWATRAIAGNSLIIRTRSSLYSFADGAKLR